MNIVGTYYTNEFSLIRIIENRIIPGDFKIGMDINLPPGQDMKKQLQALNCIADWIDNTLDQSIAFNLLTKVNTTTIEDLSNNIVLTPGEPQDHLLLLLLYQKITAISRNFIDIIQMNIESSNSGGYTYHYNGENHNLLPNIDDWMGKYRYFEKPWWERSDGSTFEMLADETDDLSAKPDILTDLWSEYEDREPAPIIKLNKTELKVIDTNTNLN